MIQNNELDAILAKLSPEEQAKIRAKMQGGKSTTRARVKLGDTGLTISINQKGGLSFYGTGRFPMSVYAPYLIKLLSVESEIKAYITEHAAELSWSKEEDKKADKEAKKEAAPVAEALVPRPNWKPAQAAQR